MEMDDGWVLLSHHRLSSLSGVKEANVSSPASVGAIFQTPLCAADAEVCMQKSMCCELRTHLCLLFHNEFKQRTSYVLYRVAERVSMPKKERKRHDVSFKTKRAVSRRSRLEPLRKGRRIVLQSSVKKILLLHHQLLLPCRVLHDLCLSILNYTTCTFPMTTVHKRLR